MSKKTIKQFYQNKKGEPFYPRRVEQHLIKDAEVTLKEYPNASIDIKIKGLNKNQGFSLLDNHSKVLVFDGVEKDTYIVVEYFAEAKDVEVDV